MTEDQLHDFVKELQSNSLELGSFISENSPDLENKKLDDLIRDYESDYLSLRDFVIQALEL